MNAFFTRVYVGAVLRLMALMFRFSPRFRRDLLDVRPDGHRFEFKAAIIFRTKDGRVRLSAVFGGGRMRVGGRPDHPDLIMTFRDTAAMAAQFSLTNPKDTLIALLENELAIDGSVSCLAKFGYLTRALTHRPRKKGAVTSHGAAAPKSGMSAAAPAAPTPAPAAPTPAPASPAAAPASPTPLSACPTPVPDIWAQREPMRQERSRAKPADEVHFLDDPYLSDYDLASFPRLKAAREALFDAPAEVCTERARLITEYYLANGFEKDAAGRDLEPYLRQAGAFNHLMTHKQAIIRADDLLAGTTTTRGVGVVIYPEFSGITLWPELLTVGERALNPYAIADEDVAALNYDVFPFWMDRNVREFSRAHNGNPTCQRLEERWVLYFMWKTAAVSHTIPDYAMVLRRGLADIRREAAKREGRAPAGRARDFYRAAQLSLDGVMDYAARLAAEADRQGAALPAGSPRRAELEEMARVCRKVPAGPAETLHEAVNAIWLCKLALHQENMNAGLSIGRLDQLLNPYYLADVEKAAAEGGEEGRRKAVERAIELTGCFFLKCADHLPMVPDIGNRLFGGSSSDQALTVGGVAPDGGDGVNDMTYVILKVTEMLGLRDPNVNARFAPGVNSETYLRRLCEVNLITAATPSLHNDGAVVPSLVNQGFALEHARDWGATGCVEPTSCGRHFGHTNCMLLNVVAPLEMALNDGVHPLLGERVGPTTGDPADPAVFPTFDDFKRAYLEQLRYLIGQSIEYNNQLGRAHQYLHPTPFLSALFDGPMANGRDVIDGGADYNSSGAAMVALTDVVDSLMSIKRLVYEEKTVDFRTLLAALRADFAGYETLHARIMNHVPKFGMDDPEPIQLAKELVDFIYHEYQSHRNYRGGPYTSGFWSMSNHVAFGTLSGALPSGRRRGQPFTPGITPAPGHDDNLLSNIRTIAALDPLELPNNIAFNVKLVPGPRDGHEQTLDRFAAYVRTYFELGGMQMQFNVVASRTLREAMERPQDYRWLLVRISGYNAYFVELNRDMQEELVARAERSLG